ncbi:hypothetical protein KM043_012620 [Ampulex compressa]|nr:hypothetical protein KM043_012620 [Ampulex compressa]
MAEDLASTPRTAASNPPPVLPRREGRSGNALEKKIPAYGPVFRSEEKNRGGRRRRKAGPREDYAGIIGHPEGAAMVPLFVQPTDSHHWARKRAENRPLPPDFYAPRSPLLRGCTELCAAFRPGICETFWALSRLTLGKISGQTLNISAAEEDLGGCYS